MEILAGVTMEQRIERVNAGWDWLRRSGVGRRFAIALRAVTDWTFVLFGQFPARAWLSLLFLGSAFIQLAIFYQFPDTPSGLDAITANERLQVVIICVMAGMGWALALWDRLELLVIGALMWLFYASMTAEATFSGAIDIRGYLAFLYLFVITGLAVGRAYDRVLIKREENERLEIAAQLKAFKVVRDAKSSGGE